MTEPIDWDAAVHRAGRVARPGPPVDRHGLLELVASLRQAAADAPAYVADVTGLRDAAEIAAEQPALVVDRPRWSEAAAETFRSMTAGQLPPARLPGAARLAGEQLGWVLALLSSRVLGQFDPYVGDEPGRGRLLVVAPNVLAVQRQLDADAQDFHLWVCLHEQTHAVQFAAAPWLADHLRGALRQVLSAGRGDGDGDDADEGIGALLGRLRRALRPGSDDDGTDGDDHGGDDRAGDDVGLDIDVPVDDVEDDEDEFGPDQTSDAPRGGAEARVRDDGAHAPGGQTLPTALQAVLGPQEQEALAGAVAVMSLLEGHADVVMDEVGPSAVPTVRQIRAGFERRRDERTLSTILMRRLLGLDAKLLQYRNGAAFVRGVRDTVGHAGLNAVWQGPENLPTPQEIADPAAWVARVHG